MKPVYIIRKVSPIGATFYVYKEQPHLKEIDVKIIDTVDNRQVDVKALSRHFILTSNLSKYIDEGLYHEDEKFLPYTADVTEDLPSLCKWEPLTYKSCKLMTETHGTYLQFYHEETGKVLRIAMNSHTYTPVNK